MKPIRVLIADDHPIVRHGISSLFEGQPHIKIVVTAASFDEVRLFLASPDVATIDCFVLDLGGMGDAPISLITHLYRQLPGARVVVFSSNLKLAPDITALGVQGYVAKEEMSQHLINAIDAVMAGGTYYSPGVQDYLDQSASVRKFFHITSRELTVLQQLSDGFSTLEIGVNLCIDGRTAQNHISTLLRKLKCSNRSQLIVWYRQMYGGTDPSATGSPPGAGA